MLGKLKERLTLMKDQIDEQEDRTQRAKEDLKEVQDKAEKSEAEAEGIRRRCQLLLAEYEKVTVRVEEREEMLRNVDQKNRFEENARRELEENELEGDEQSAEIEASLKEAQQLADETLSRLTEAERKVIVLEKENKIASKRCSTADQKIERLTILLESTAEKAKHLERSEDESFEREQISEEKIAFLDTQVKEQEQRADDAEAREKTTKRIRDGIEDEISAWLSKTREVEDEMKSMTDMVDDM